MNSLPPRGAPVVRVLRSAPTAARRFSRLLAFCGVMFSPLCEVLGVELTQLEGRSERLAELWRSVEFERFVGFENGDLRVSALQAGADGLGVLGVQARRAVRGMHGAGKGNG
jgi:hypothetical protein